MKREPVPQDFETPMGKPSGDSAQRDCPSRTTYLYPLPTQVTKTLKLPPLPQLFPLILHLFKLLFLPIDLSSFTLARFVKLSGQMLPLPLFISARGTKGNWVGMSPSEEFLTSDNTRTAKTASSDPCRRCQMQKEGTHFNASDQEKKWDFTQGAGRPAQRVTVRLT